MVLLTLLEGLKMRPHWWWVVLVETLLDLAVTLFETPLFVVVLTWLEFLKLRSHWWSA